MALPFVKEPVQVSRVHRLQQMSINPGLGRLSPVFLVPVPGDGNQQSTFPVGLFPNLPGDRPAVDPRQADV
jgi:hypothetical protein